MQDGCDRDPLWAMKQMNDGLVFLSPDEPEPFKGLCFDCRVALSDRIRDKRRDFIYPTHFQSGVR